METKVYLADVRKLENKKIFNDLYSRVSPGRREKADRMVFPKDKYLSLGAGALLEAALAAEGVTDLTMTTMQNKKPCLLYRNDIKFNISHSGTKVMCAVSDCDIGCDVEQIIDVDKKIAKRFFFSEEYKALMRCESKDSYNDLFFRYWTLKESFMKATGLGFKLALDEFSISFDNGSISVKQNFDKKKYYFAEYDLKDGYKYALCSADKAISTKKVIEYDFDQPNNETVLTFV